MKEKICDNISLYKGFLGYEFEMTALPTSGKLFPFPLSPRNKQEKCRAGENG